MNTEKNCREPRSWRGSLVLFLAMVLVLDPALRSGLLRADETAVLTSVADSWIDQGSTATNKGTDNTLQVRSQIGPPLANNRATVRFDLTTVPAGSAVKTSTLDMFVNSAPSPPRINEVHLVTGTTLWTEAGVTWNVRLPGTNWTTPGGDFDVAAVASTPVTGGQVHLTWNVLNDGTVTNIPQGWLDTPSSNLGLIIKDSAESASGGGGFLVQYVSREQGTSRPIPNLTVHYLRNVTLVTQTPGISEITQTWTFPSGSTSANYDGVLISKVAGSLAPSITPVDGTTFLVGTTPKSSVVLQGVRLPQLVVPPQETVAINTNAFGITTAIDENGAASIVLPGTQYTYKAFTHDATTITGAAFGPPHYSKGVASTSVTTFAGGGANKNWSYLTGATTLAAPALNPGVTVVAGSNDSKVHSMSASNGGRNYQPAGLIGTTSSGAIQSRPSIIGNDVTTQPTCAHVCDVAYVGAGDGKVYAFRTDTGAALWTSQPLLTNTGGSIQGAPAVQVKAFTNAAYTLGFDLVIVGTRNLTDTIGNKIYGLNGNTGAVVWTFAPGNLDMINSTPNIDFVNNVVWVSSRSGTGMTQPSLWKLNTVTGTLVKSINLPTTNKDIDGSPTLNDAGSFLYVLTNGADLVAVQVSSNTVFSTNVGTGAGVGFPTSQPGTVAGTEDLYFSSTVTTSSIIGTVHKRTFDLTAHTFAAGWNTGLVSASTPIFPPSASFVYAGAKDGKLHKLAAATGIPDATQRTVNIVTTTTVGDPSFDTVLSRFYVGDSSGRIYSFDLF